MIEVSLKGNKRTRGAGNRVERWCMDSGEDSDIFERDVLWSGGCGYVPTLI